MSGGTEFREEMEAEDRREWLAAEYARLRESAKPVIAEWEALQGKLDETKNRGEEIARRAFGVLVAAGKTEAEAAKEILTWRKPAG